MKFQYISDIHLDSNPRSASNILTPAADTIILAGDIGSVYKLDIYVKFVLELTEMYKRVIIVLGNHEFYRKGDFSIPFGMVVQIYKLLFVSNPKVTVLYNEDHEDADTIIFGTTYWFPCQTLRYNIFYNNDYITATEMTFEHQKCIIEIENAIQCAKRQNKKLLVVSHFPPYNFKTIKDYDYVSTWIYGHTHINKNFFDEIKFVTNQLPDKKTYDKSAVLEI